MTNKDLYDKLQKYDTDMQKFIDTLLNNGYVNPPDIKDTEIKDLTNKLIENCAKLFSENKNNSTSKNTVGNYYLEVRDAQKSAKLKSCIDNSIKNKRLLLYGVF